MFTQEVQSQRATPDLFDDFVEKFCTGVTGSAFSEHEAALRASDTPEKDGLDIFVRQHQAASQMTEDLPAFKLLATLEAQVLAGTYSRMSAKDPQPSVSASYPASLVASLPSSPLRNRSRVVPKCFEPIRGEEIPPPAAAPNMYRGYSGKPIVRGHYGISSRTPSSSCHPRLSSRRTDCLMRPGQIAEADVMSRRGKHVPIDHSSTPRMQTGPGGQWELQPPKQGTVRPHEQRMEHSALRGTPLEKRDRGPGFMARWLGSETERIGREVRQPVSHLGAFVHQGGAAHPSFLGAPLVHDGFEIAN
jgi:hypothetical protein